MALSIDELYKHKKEIELDLQKMERVYSKTKTSHILHLLLSLLTAGIWLIVWLLVANTNARKKIRLEKLMDQSKSTLIDIDRKLIPEAENNKASQTQKATIECPWCAEEILEKAKICKHCGKEVQITENA